MRVGLGGGRSAALGCGRGGIAGSVVVVAIVGRGGGRRRGGIHDVAGSVAGSLPFGLGGAGEGRTDVLGILARADAAHALGGAVSALVGGEVDDAGESDKMVRPILVDETELPHTRTKGEAIRLEVHIIVHGTLALALLGLGLRLGTVAAGNTGNIAIPSGECVHEGRLEKLDRLVAQPVPEGRSIELVGLEAKEPPDRLGHEEEPAGRIEHNDEVGYRPEDLLLPPQDGILVAQVLDELLLPLPAELGRSAVGRSLHHLLLLDGGREGVRRTGEADRGGMMLLMVRHCHFRGGAGRRILDRRRSGSSDRDGRICSGVGIGGGWWCLWLLLGLGLN